MSLTRYISTLALSGLFVISSGCNQQDDVNGTNPSKPVMAEPSAIMLNNSFGDASKYNVKVFEYIPKNAPDKLIIIAENRAAVDIEVIDLSSAQAEQVITPE